MEIKLETMRKAKGRDKIKRWLAASGVEFWLPLPFLAIAFWFGSHFLMIKELSQSRPTDTKLSADTQLEATVSINILLINAAIDRHQKVTLVEVKTTEPILKRLEMELPIVEPDQIEEAIAKELQLSRQDVRQLVRYEIIK